MDEHSNDVSLARLRTLSDDGRFVEIQEIYRDEAGEVRARVVSRTPIDMVDRSAERRAAKRALAPLPEVFTEDVDASRSA